MMNEIPPAEELRREMTHKTLYIGRLGFDTFPVQDPVTMQTYVVCKTEKEALDYIKAFDWDNPPIPINHATLGKGTVIPTNPIPTTPKPRLARSARRRK